MANSGLIQVGLINMMAGQVLGLMMADSGGGHGSLFDAPAPGQPAITMTSGKLASHSDSSREGQVKQTAYDFMNESKGLSSHLNHGSQLYMLEF